MSVTTEQVQVQVEINGQKAGSTIKELQSTAKELRKELNQLPTDTDAFTKKAAELQKVNTQLKEINSSVKAVDKSLEDAGKTGGLFSNVLSGAFSVFLGGGISGIVQSALSGIKDFFVGSVKGAQEMNRSLAQLEQALHGDTAAAKELANQASELEVALKGLFSEEDIKDAQARLALYTDESEQIKKLTPQILDLAAAKGVDLTTAADAVGKSLEGDADGLKKMGISVKDAATEEERFAIITQGLTDKVGGQAQVVADTTKTGWDQLVVKWDEMSKSVGEKLIPIINSLGEFLSDLWDKSKPVVDIFKTIFGVFGQVWDAIKQLIASFGSFGDKASFAEQIMKGLALVMKPMQMAWQGISYAIKGVSTVLNELVAGANGTVQALVAIFSNFKTFFTNLFSNIGEVIKGVFTLDADQIKQGIAGMKTSFTSMGGEIATAYNKGYTEVRDRQKAALATQEEAEHKENVKNTEKKTKELTDAEKKALEDAAKKKAAAQQKAADEELKRQADLNNKLAELYKQVEDIHIAAMQDGEEKSIAHENLRYQREQDAQVQRMNDLRKAGADEATIKAENDKFTEDAETQHQNNLQDIHIKAAAKQKADAQKTADDLQKEQDDAYKKQLDATNQFYDTLAVGVKQNLDKRIVAENLNSDQIAAEKEKAAAALLQLQLAKNEELLNVQKQYGQDTTQVENDIADEKMQLIERTANFRKASEDEMRGIVNDSLSFTIDALSQDEEARKKNAEAIKAFSIAQVLIDVQKEIQAIWATSNASPTNILFPGSGNVIAGIKTALAVGRATLAASKIAKQKFTSGGYTGEGVDIFDGSGDPVAGVVHAKEWVAPKWMVSHPSYHTVINRLEGVRQRGFAQGGFTTTPVNNISTNLDLMGTENKLDQLINAFKEFPSRLKADVVYTEFETVAQNVNDVRTAAQVGK